MIKISRLKSTQRITDDVYNTLRDAILNHKLEAGDALSVPELARQLGVSRTPVRDGIFQLIADGLAVGRPRKGATVAKLDEKELLSIHEIREVLEGLSARRAATRINDAQLAKLNQILARQEEYVAKGDSPGYMETDEEFHRVLATASEEPRLVQFLRILHGQMGISSRLSTLQPGHLKRGLRNHKSVLKAVAAHDPNRAEREMRAHVSRSRKRLETLFSRSMSARSKVGE